MKTKLFLSALAICAIGLASCQKEPEPEPNPYDKEKIYGSKLETQYQLEDERLDWSVLDRFVFVYKSYDELTELKEGYTSPYTWFINHNHKEKVGDIFAPYDDSFFENHILFCGMLNLAEEGELYFVSLDEEPIKSTAVDNGNRNFYRIFFEEVYPDETYSPDFIGDSDLSKYKLTYWFYAYEIPEDSTLPKEYVKYATETLLSTSAKIDPLDYNTIYWWDGNYKYLSNQKTEE